VVKNLYHLTYYTKYKFVSQPILKNKIFGKTECVNQIDRDIKFEKEN